MNILAFASGGPAPGVGYEILELARLAHVQGHTVFLSLNSFDGIVSGKGIIPLIPGSENFKRYEKYPGGFCGRTANGNFLSESDYQAAAAHMAVLEIDAIAPIGGDGSMIHNSRFIEKTGFQGRTATADKSIDNDNSGSTDCIGAYDSASGNAEELVDIVEAAIEGRRVIIAEVMGRLNPYLALHTAVEAEKLFRQKHGEVYLAGSQAVAMMLGAVKFKRDSVVTGLGYAYNRPQPPFEETKGAVIVVSEGVQDFDGKKRLFKKNGGDETPITKDGALFILNRLKRMRSQVAQSAGLERIKPFLRTNILSHGQQTRDLTADGIALVRKYAAMQLYALTTPDLAPDLKHCVVCNHHGKIRFLPLSQVIATPHIFDPQGTLCKEARDLGILLGDERPSHIKKRAELEKRLAEQERRHGGRFERLCLKL